MTAKVDGQLVLDRVIDRMNEDPRVDAAQVAVDISPHGTATLRGTVPSYEARQAAEEDALSVPGVRKIFDYLTVTVPGPMGLTEPEGEGDEGMLLRISRIIMGEKPLATERIDVSIQEGKAILEGSVNAFWKRDRAGEVVLAADGVREVVNLLTVVPTDSRFDEDIAGQIMDALSSNCLIDEEAVDVKVNRALVTLRGTVPSEKARREAFQAALYAHGVVDVRDELIIAPAAE